MSKWYLNLAEYDNEINWAYRRKKKNEPQRDKKTIKQMTCAHQRLQSALAFAQSYQSLLCTLRIAKNQRLLHADSEHWLVFAGCWFCRAAVQMIVEFHRGNILQGIFWSKQTLHNKFELPHDKTQQNGMCAQWRLCPVWSGSSLSTWSKLRSLATHWAHNEDSDQTVRMPRLIWVFIGCTCHFVGFVMRRFIRLWLLNSNVPGVP